MSNVTRREMLGWSGAAIAGLTSMFALAGCGQAQEPGTASGATTDVTLDAA